MTGDVRMKRGLFLAIALLGAHGVVQAADPVVVDSRYSSDAGFLPAVNAARDAAAGYALSRAMVTNIVAKHCQQILVRTAKRIEHLCKRKLAITRV